MSHLRFGRLNRSYVALGVVVLLVYMLFAHQDRLSLSSLPYRAIQPTDLTAQRIKTLPKTEVLAHAPGFSVIENL